MAKFCRKCGAPLPAGKSRTSGSSGSQQPEILICPKCGKNLAKKSKTKVITPKDQTEVLDVNNGQPAANPAQPAAGKDQLPPLALAGKLAALQQTLPPSLTHKQEKTASVPGGKEANPSGSGSSAPASAPASKTDASNAAAQAPASPKTAAAPKAAGSHTATANATKNAIAALNQNTFANAPTVNLPIFAALKQKKRKSKSKFFRILQIIIIACLAFAAVYYGHKLYSWYCSIRKAATILISDCQKPSHKKRLPISLPTAAKTPAPLPSLSPAESPVPDSGLPETSASPLPTPAPTETSVPGANEPANSTQPALPPPVDVTPDTPESAAPSEGASNDTTIPSAPKPPANADNTPAPAPDTAPVKPSAVREPVIQGRYAFSKADMEPNPEQHQLALEKFLQNSILIANNDGTLEVMEIDNNPYYISNDGYKYELKPQTIKIMGTHKAGTGTCAIQGKCKVSEVYSTPHAGAFYSPPKGKETKTQYNSKDYTLSYLGSGEIKQFPGHNQESLSIYFTLNCDAEGKENNIEHSYHANGDRDSNTSNKIIDNHWNELLTVTYRKISD